MKKFLLILLVFLFCSSCQQKPITNNWRIKDLLIVREELNRENLKYRYLDSYDVYTTIDNVNYVLSLKDNVSHFKYIDKSIDFDTAIDTYLKKCINLDIRKRLDDQLVVIEKLYDKLDSYNKKRIAEDAVTINFDNYYDIVYEDDPDYCQYLLDCGYLCNFIGIWIHHNWPSFWELFNKLDVGWFAILDGYRYKVKSIMNGVAYKWEGYFYSYENNIRVPEYTNKYMITCYGFDYGDTWGIRIIEFEY